MTQFLEIRTCRSVERVNRTFPRSVETKADYLPVALPNHWTRISAKPFILQLYANSVLLKEFKGDRTHFSANSVSDNFYRFWSFLIGFYFFHHSCPEQLPWENFNINQKTMQCLFNSYLWFWEERQPSYIYPVFILHQWFVEVKGVLTKEESKKYIAVKTQHPTLKICFCFQNDMFYFFINGWLLVKI